MSEISALHLIRDGAATAAELLALLFMAPLATASAAENGPATRPPAAVIAPADVEMPVFATPVVDTPTSGWRAARELHAVGATLDVRLLGLLADVRVVQTVRNDSLKTVDLGARLTAADESYGRLSIARAGHRVALPPASVDDCESDAEDPHAGHVRLALDELLADLLHLAPGQRATIDIGSTRTLEPLGDAYRVELPATMAPLEAQALLVEQVAGVTLIVVAPAGTAGLATLTLRPANLPARDIPLGQVSAGSAIVVPLADTDALVQLARGAIELEYRNEEHVLWTTLPSTVRSDRPSTLARAAQ